MHRDLLTGAAPRRLIAVEETSTEGRRRIRTATRRDRAAIRRASKQLEATRDDLALPQGKFNPQRRDDRPISLGIVAATDAFSDRQLLILGSAFAAADAAPTPEIRSALRLAVSNALTTNNKLCGYATDYGRIAPLFSVRSYSLPILSIELNPLHPYAGRGTLRRCIEKVVRASATEPVVRSTWSPSLKRVVRNSHRFEHSGSGAEVFCASSAAHGAIPPHSVDACVFDPPYFDYIAYSELSEFYRLWQPDAELGGTPLLPNATKPVESFGRTFGECLRMGLTRLKPGRLMAFTYHASSAAAWDAIGIALDRASLTVTALWPVRNDGHMGMHTDAGNCEWDIVVVCRRRAECRPAEVPFTCRQWMSGVAPLRVSRADKDNMTHALAIASGRFGIPLATGTG